MNPERLLQLIQGDRTIVEKTGNPASAGRIESPNPLLPTQTHHHLCNLTVQASHISDAGSLQNLISDQVVAFPDLEGWFCRESEVYAFTDAAGITDACSDPSGPIRFGELVLDDQTSLHILPGEGVGWHYLTVTEGEGSDYLAEEVIHLGQKHGGFTKNLAYLRYWQPDSERGYLITATRFTGFRAREDRVGASR